MNRAFRIGFTVAAVTLLLTACSDREPPVPFGIDVTPPEPTGPGLEISSMDVPVGGRVNVAVTLDLPSGGSAAALQARLRFDRTKLRYAGQVAVGGALTVVNAESVGSGELPLLSFALEGLDRRAAIVSFEVTGPGYGTGLELDIELVADSEGRLLEVVDTRGIFTATDLTTAGVTLSAPSTDELAHAAGFRPVGEGVALVLSSIAEIGDCNQDAIVSALDLIAIARVAVGLDPSPADPSDFRLCDADDSGGLDVLDVLDVSRYAVGVPTIAAPVGFAYDPVTGSEGHTCALDDTGQAYCWGRGAQLGDGVGALSETPLPVAGARSYTTLTSGESFTCGLETTGQAWCWGTEASVGVLGDGTFTDSDVPVAVAGGHAFVALSNSTDDHACGIESNGAAWCWGQQQGGGRLGDGVTTTDQGSPVPVAGGHAFVDIGGAWYYTCGIDVNGQAFCWGSLAGYAVTPDSIGIGLTFTEIGGGFLHHCALDTTGAAHCWGDNSYGQLGDGSGVNQTAPVPVSGGLTFARLVSGRYNSCGIDASGQAYCWGSDVYGQIGDGAGSSNCSAGLCRPTPTAVSGSIAFSILDIGYNHVCGVDTAGGRWCWGQNDSGKLGVGPGAAASPLRTTPTSTVSMPPHNGVSLGSAHGCVLESGQPRCWGWNALGQLGNGTTVSESTPVAVSVPQSLVSISAGGSHTCGTDATGGGICWGSNGLGQLGDGTTTDALTPVSVVGAPILLSIATGAQHTCGLERTGVAWCWGGNFQGALGDGTNTSRSVPDSVRGGLSLQSLALGSGHTCGLDVNGVAYCWGLNLSGQLGDGSTVDRLLPVAVGGGVALAELFTGANASHTCGLTAGGAAYCWGRNFSGALGDGTTVDSSLPVPVAGGIAFRTLLVGGNHTCGIESGTDRMYCWGSNGNGQLGDGTTTDRTQPALVVGGTGTWLDAAAGGAMTCGRDLGGTTYCWGSNSDGQLSIGVTAGSDVPIQVLPF